MLTEGNVGKNNKSRLSYTLIKHGDAAAFFVLIILFTLRIN